VIDASDVDPDLVRAYGQAIYRVLADPPFDLRVDVHSRQLKAWQHDCGVSCSALITAANPGSQPLPDGENRSRTRRLERDLQGWSILPTQNIDPDGVWPIEQGFLVAGMTPEVAGCLAERWQQIAWLQMATDAVPELFFRQHDR